MCSWFPWYSLFCCLHSPDVYIKTVSVQWGEVHYAFTGSAYTQTVYAYPTSSCTGLLLTIVINANYAISNVTRSSFDLQGNFDETLTGYTVAVSDNSTLATYNSSSMCGYNNWILNVPKNVLGRSCNGGQIPSAGTVNYNLINSVYATTSFGPPSSPTVYTAVDLTLGTSTSGNDGTTPARRYNTLNGNQIYTKQ